MSPNKVGGRAMRTGTLSVIALALCPALAQAGEWDYTATLYGWLPGISGTLETSFGDADLGQSTSDVLSNLDMAFMGAFEAQNGRWGLAGDLLYTDLSDDEDTPFGDLFSSIDVGVKVGALSGYVTYRVLETPYAAYDIAGGFRAFSVDVAQTLEAGRLPTRTSSASESWAVPIIGARGIWRLSDKWSASAFADFGGTGSGDNQTWQFVGTLNYEFNDNWSGRFGYRHMEINKTIGGSDLDIGLSGPVFGFAYRF